MSSDALSPSVHTISQLIIFNTINHSRVQRHTVSTSRYHRLVREPPIPVYTALKLHALTKKKQLIESLFSMGICVSYTKAQDIISYTFTAVYIWGQCLIVAPVLPSPEAWGLSYSTKWEPKWSDISLALNACSELVKCRCRKHCESCICVAANQPCTMFCSCKENCENTE